jgi:hypothetical protein
LTRSLGVMKRLIDLGTVARRLKRGLYGTCERSSGHGQRHVVRLF